MNKNSLFLAFCCLIIATVISSGVFAEAPISPQGLETDIQFSLVTNGRLSAGLNLQQVGDPKLEPKISRWVASPEDYLTIIDYSDVPGFRLEAVMESPDNGAFVYSGNSELQTSVAPNFFKLYGGFDSSNETYLPPDIGVDTTNTTLNILTNPVDSTCTLMPSADQFRFHEAFYVEPYSLDMSSSRQLLLGWNQKTTSSAEEIAPIESSAEVSITAPEELPPIDTQPSTEETMPDIEDSGSADSPVPDDTVPNEDVEIDDTEEPDELSESPDASSESEGTDESPESPDTIPGTDEIGSSPESLEAPESSEAEADPDQLESDIPTPEISETITTPSDETETSPDENSTPPVEDFYIPGSSATETGESPTIEDYYLPGVPAESPPPEISAPETTVSTETISEPQSVPESTPSVEAVVAAYIAELTDVVLVSEPEEASPTTEQPQSQNETSNQQNQTPNNKCGYRQDLRIAAISLNYPEGSSPGIYSSNLVIIIVDGNE